jgi:FemAB-related protein (PEP-CTERM system-associated)
MMMDVVLLTRDLEKAWQHFVDGSPEATLGHLLAWRNVVQKTYHHLPYYLIAMDGQGIEGVLPLFLIRSPFFGRFLVTAPYLSYGGLLANDERAGSALIQAARQVAAEQKAKYIEVRGLSRVKQGLLLKDKYCTFLLPLSVGPDVLWQRFEGGRARKVVRKALKSGLIVERGHHLTAIFADVMSRHMRDLGTPFHPAQFYQHITEEFPHQSEILMVKYGDRYIAGILLVSHRDTVYDLYAAALREYKSLGAGSLLIWDAIRSACDRGFESFDFGRSRWDSGTFFFKRQWRAQPVPLFYEYHLSASAGLPDVDPTNAGFGWAIALWKRLPVFAAKALGPSIIKDIP